MLNRDTAEAVAWGRMAIALAERFDDRPELIGGLNSVGSALVVSGDQEGGRELLERSLRLAQEDRAAPQVANAYTNLGSAFGEVFRLADADRYLSVGIAYATEHDLDAARLYGVAWLALTRLHQGAGVRRRNLAVEVNRRPSSWAISRIMAHLALAGPGPAGRPRGVRRARRGAGALAPTEPCNVWPCPCGSGGGGVARRPARPHGCRGTAASTWRCAKGTPGLLGAGLLAVVAGDLVTLPDGVLSRTALQISV
jgi:hypothetical protein